MLLKKLLKDVRAEGVVGDRESGTNVVGMKRGRGIPRLGRARRLLSAFLSRGGGRRKGRRGYALLGRVGELEELQGGLQRSAPSFSYGSLRCSRSYTSSFLRVRFSIKNSRI